MRKSLFLDTNVVMDIIFRREEFLSDSLQLLALRENDVVEFYVSTLTLSHTAHFAKKFGKKPREVISVLLKWMSATDLRVSHFEDTVVSRFSDFEDGLQYFSAKDIKGIDYLITRNQRDFRNSEIPVMSPKEFTSYYQSGK
jgi:predicted nucleic acid-binding protein